jgi:hypothetical protein
VGGSPCITSSIGTGLINNTEKRGNFKVNYIVDTEMARSILQLFVECAEQ